MGVDATGSAVMDKADGDMTAAVEAATDGTGFNGEVTVPPVDVTTDAGGATLISGLTEDADIAAMTGDP